jgi:hypothetical protein
MLHASPRIGDGCRFPIRVAEESLNMPEFGSTGPISPPRSHGTPASCEAIHGARIRSDTLCGDAERLARIDSIRQQISEGSYLSEDRLREAIRRAIDDLRR